VDEHEAKQARYLTERAKMLNILAARVKALRKERGYKSQEKLAEATDLHRTYIGCLERGEREPSTSILLILADVLKVPPGQLIEGLPVPEERRPRPRRKQPPAADR
jgi:transcriptional regulator with XRE-family HTH domain